MNSRLRRLQAGLTRMEIGSKYERRRDYFWVLTGTLLMALSANLCFTPAKMVPGGFTGLAIIIKYATAPIMPAWMPAEFSDGLPTWLSNAMLNVPLILAAIYVRGWKKFMRRTFAASIIFSLWLLVVPEYALMGDDLFLTTIVGGALMGAGLGFVFLGKATTGGTDTLGALIQRAFPHMSTAKLMQLLDAAVILLSVWIFGVQISMYHGKTDAAFGCGRHPSLRLDFWRADFHVRCHFCSPVKPDCRWHHKRFPQRLLGVYHFAPPPGNRQPHHARTQPRRHKAIRNGHVYRPGQTGSSGRRLQEAGCHPAGAGRGNRSGRVHDPHRCTGDPRRGLPWIQQGRALKMEPPA